MAWVKLTDHFDDDPDIAMLPGDSVALFICMLSYTARQLTDGFISDLAAKKLPFFTKKTVEKLTAPDIEWLIKTDGGFLIRNYLFYNPSAESVKGKKDKTNLRVKKHREKLEELKRVTDGVGNALRNGGCNAPPVPVPVPTVLSEPFLMSSEGDISSLNGSLIDSQIEEILSHYPKRLGGQKRPVAVAKLKSLLKKAGAYEEILEGTKRYAQSVITLETPPKMVMMMATFYNGGLWRDTYDVDAQSANSQPKIYSKAERDEIKKARKLAQGELDEF